MPINNKTLRDANWKQVYHYDCLGRGFTTFACDDLPGLTITKDHRGGKVYKTRYKVAGKTSDSPAQAVRDYNAEEKRQRDGHQAPGSVGAIKERKATGL